MAKYKKYRTYYLPKEIVDNLLLKLNVIQLDFEFKVEIGLSIIYDILNKSLIFNKDDDYPFHFSPLDSRYLKLKYGDCYVNHIRFLINNGIIFRDASYEGKTTYYYLQYIEDYESNNNSIQLIRNINIDYILSSYCFLEDVSIGLLRAENKGVDLIRKNRIYNDWYEVKILIVKNKNDKYLTASYVKDSIFINNTIPHVKKMGSYYRNNLKLNVDDALEFIENKYESDLKEAITKDDKKTVYRKYSTRMASVFNIKNGKTNKSFRFNRNGTNHRVDSNLTNMASDLRRFIVGYDEMVYLDLKNSQPVLFNILLREFCLKGSLVLKNEVDEYFKLTIGGRWYERLQELYGMSRDECKDLWMKIAYSKNTSYKYKKKIFKKYYPEINSIIELCKKDNHADFSIQLQKIESEIFIDEICKELVGMGIVPYSLHDGLLVSKEHEGVALNVMQSILKKHLGAKPRIEIKKTINGVLTEYIR